MHFESGFHNRSVFARERHHVADRRQGREVDVTSESRGSLERPIERLKKAQGQRTAAKIVGGIARIGALRIDDATASGSSADRFMVIDHDHVQAAARAPSSSTAPLRHSPQ